MFIRTNQSTAISHISLIMQMMFNKSLGASEGGMATFCLHLIMISLFSKQACAFQHCSHMLLGCCSLGLFVQLIFEFKLEIPSISLVSSICVKLNSVIYDKAEHARILVHSGISVGVSTVRVVIQEILLVLCKEMQSTHMRRGLGSASFIHCSVYVT